MVKFLDSAIARAWLVKLPKTAALDAASAGIGCAKTASKVIQGNKVPSNINAIVVPGSQIVKIKAERLGLDKIFKDAGFDWRESGCSMCLAMNPDKLSPGERCASTSNRNFEGRQGKGGRTHLVSPVMAAAAAINGRFTDIRSLDLDLGEY